MAFDPLALAALDELALSGEESLKLKAARKKAALPVFAKKGILSDVIDGDTYAILEAEKNIRLAGGINTAESVDASFENKGRMDAQRKAYGTKYNVPWETVTLDNIKREGLAAKNKALEVLGGEGAEVYYRDRGIDRYGRQLADVYNIEGESVGEALDTREFNYGIDAAYNADKQWERGEARRAEAARAGGGGDGFNEEGMPELQVDSKGMYAYAGHSGLTKGDFENRKEAYDAEIAQKDSWRRKLGGGFIGGVADVAGMVYSGTGTVKDYMLKTGVDRIKYTEGHTLDQMFESANSPFRTMIGEEEKAAFNEIMAGKGELTPEQNEFLGTKEGKYMLRMASEFQGKQDDFGKIAANAKERSSVVDRRKSSTVEHKFKKLYEEKGLPDALLYAAKNAPMFGYNMIESLPMMVGLAIPGVDVGMIATMSEAGTVDAVQEFKLRNKREPTDKEVNTMMFWSLSSALFEKFGVSRIVKGNPQFIKNILKEAKMLEKPLAFIAKGVESTFSEGMSGGGSEFSTQMAVKQDVSQVDMGDVAYGAVEEALGALGMTASAGTVRVLAGERDPNKILNKKDKKIDQLTKSMGKEITDKKRTKYEKQVETIRAELESVVANENASEEYKVRAQEMLDKLPEVREVVEEEVATGASETPDTVTKKVSEVFSLDPTPENKKTQTAFVKDTVDRVIGSEVPSKEDIETLIATDPLTEGKEGFEEVDAYYEEKGTELQQAIGRYNTANKAQAEEGARLGSLGETEIADPADYVNTEAVEAHNRIAERMKLSQGRQDGGKKTLANVFKDVFIGSEGYTGFQDYINAAVKGKFKGTVKKNFGIFASHMQGKANAFREAYDKSTDTEPMFVFKDNRGEWQVVPADPRAETSWEIRPTMSKHLVPAVEIEAANAADYLIKAEAIQQGVADVEGTKGLTKRVLDTFGGKTRPKKKEETNGKVQKEEKQRESKTAEKEGSEESGEATKEAEPGVKVDGVKEEQTDKTPVDDTAVNKLIDKYVSMKNSAAAINSTIVKQAVQSPSERQGKALHNLSAGMNKIKKTLHNMGLTDKDIRDKIKQKGEKNLTKSAKSIIEKSIEGGQYAQIRAAFKDAKGIYYFAVYDGSRTTILVDQYWNVLERRKGRELFDEVERITGNKVETVSISRDEANDILKNKGKKTEVAPESTESATSVDDTAVEVEEEIQEANDAFADVQEEEYQSNFSEDEELNSLFDENEPIEENDYSEELGEMKEVLEESEHWFDKIKDKIVKFINLQTKSFAEVLQPVGKDTPSILNLLNAQGLEINEENIRKIGYKLAGVKDRHKVDGLARMFTMFKESGEKTVNKNLGKAYLKHTFSSLLIDENGEGKVPDEMYYAMAVAFSEWISINGPRTLTNARRDVSMILYSERDHALTDTELSVMTDIGMPIYNEVTGLGSSMSKVLGLKAKASKKIDNVEVNDVSDHMNFERIIGLMAMDIAANIGDGGIISITHYEKLDLGRDSGANLNGKNLKTVKLLNGKHPMVKMFAGSSLFYKKILGTQLNSRDIFLDGPRESIQKRIGGGLSLLPKNRVRVLKKLQDRAWKPNRTNIKMFMGLTFNQQKNMLGWIDPKTKHIDERAAQRAKNKDIEQQIQALKSMEESLKEEGKDRFWLGFSMMNQFRILVDSNTIDPLNSKILHRFMVRPEGSKVTVDRKNKKQMNYFKYAIVQALVSGEGKDIDKSDYATIMKEFDKIVAELTSLVQEGDQKLSEAAIDWLMGQGKGAHGIAGMVALQAYLGKGNKFDTILGVEVDGITNGYAIGLLQFPGDVNGVWTFLEKVGITKQEGRFEQIRDQVRDVYLTAGDNFREQLSMEENRGIANYLRDLTGIDLTEATAESDKALRDLMKGPFMYYNYAASARTSTMGIAEWAIEKTKDRAEELYQEYKAGDLSAKKARELYREMNFSDELIDKILDKGFSETSVKDEMLELEKNILDDFSPIVDSAFAALTRGSDLKDELGMAMNAVAIGFGAEFDRRVEEAEADLRVVAKTRGSNRKKLTSTERMRIASVLVDTHYPFLKGAWDDVGQDGRTAFIDMVSNEKTQGTGKVENNILVEGKPQNSGTPLGAFSWGEPGAKVLVRSVQNIDSTTMGRTIDESSRPFLGIHDAYLASIDDVEGIFRLINEKFLESNESYSIAEAVLEQFRKVGKNIVERDLRIDRLVAGKAKIGQTDKSRMKFFDLKRKVTNAIKNITDLQKVIDRTGKDLLDVEQKLKEEELLLNKKKKKATAEQAAETDIFEKSEDAIKDLEGKKVALEGKQAKNIGLLREYKNILAGEFNLADEKAVDKLVHELTRERTKEEIASHKKENLDGWENKYQSDSKEWDNFNKVLERAQREGWRNMPTPPISIGNKLNTLARLVEENNENRKILFDEIKEVVQYFMPKADHSAGHGTVEVGGVKFEKASRTGRAFLFTGKDGVERNGMPLGSKDISDAVIEKIQATLHMAEKPIPVRLKGKKEIYDARTGVLLGMDLMAVQEAYSEEAGKLGSMGDPLSDTDQAAEDLKEDIYGNFLEEDVDTVNEEMKDIDGQNSQKQSASDQAHSEHIDGLLNSLIKPLLRKMDRLTLTVKETRDLANGWFDTHTNSVMVKWNREKAATASEQGAQEVYGHEIVHAVVYRALKMNARYREKVRRLRSAIKKDLGKEGWKAFLADPSLENDAAEVEIAKRQYDAAFNDGSLQEFVAYGLTNKALVNKLKSMVPKAKFELFEGDLWYEKLANALLTAAEMLSDWIDGKEKPKDAYMELLGLTQDVTGVHTSRVSKMAVNLSKINVEIADDWIRKQAGTVGQFLGEKGLVKVYEFFSKRDRKRFTPESWSDTDASIFKKAFSSMDALRSASISVLAMALMHPGIIFKQKGMSWKEKLEHMDHYAEMTMAIRKAINNRLTRELYAGLKQLVKRTPYEISRLLSISKKLIEGDRVRDKEEMQKWLIAGFEEMPDSQQSESMLQVLARTDLRSLLGTLSQQELLELVQDPDKLKALIKKEFAELGIEDNEYWNRQIEGLSDRMLKQAQGRKVVFDDVAVMNKNAGWKDKIKKEDIDRVDRLISLVALSKTSEMDRKSVAQLWEKELARKDGGNGIENIMVLSQHLYLRSREEAFKGTEMLMTKGYLPRINDPHKAIAFEDVDPKTKKEMLDKGYVFQHNLDTLPGQTTPVQGLYWAKNLALDTQTKGLFSTTALKRAHTSVLESSLKPIYAKIEKLRDVRREKGELTKAQASEMMALTESIGKRKKALLLAILRGEQLEMGFQGMDPRTALRPIVNPNGDIVDYTFDISLKHEEKYLGLNKNIFEVIPRMAEVITDKVNSEKINKEGIDMLIKRKAERFVGNEHEFIDIMNIDWKDETFVRLPKAARKEIRRHAMENDGKFWVEEAWVDALFGYRNWSLAEVVSSEKKKLFLRRMEEIVHGIVGTINNNIVIKTPDVWAGNIVSNFFTTTMSGVPIWYTLKYGKEALSEIRTIQKDGIKLRNELALISAGKGDKKKAEYLQRKINANPTMEMMDMGLYTAITTEGMFDDEFSYKNKAIAHVTEKTERLTGAGPLTKIVKAAYLAEDTSAYQSLLQLVQVSDFVGRYALYKHMTEEQGKSKREAYNYIQDVFVDYNVPVGRIMNWANSVGLILFYKYWIRIQRPILMMIREHPTRTLGALGMRALLGGASPDTIFNSGIITGGNLAPTMGWLKPVDMVKQLLIPSGIESLSGGIFFGVELGKPIWDKQKEKKKVI